MIREWLQRLRGTLGYGRADADLEEELRSHLELAHHTTSIGLTQAMEAQRDQRGLPWLEHVARDLRHAARRLRRSPAFTVASAVSLALAIGANVALFAVVQRVLLNPLPYPASDRLIKLDHAVPRLNVPSFEPIPLGLYYHYLDGAHTFAAIAAYRRGEVTLTGDGIPERIPAVWATPSLASVLRVAPAVGRWFTEEESTPGAPQVALLSHGLWVRRYGADVHIVGRSLMLNGVPTVVAGVMPASYAFPDPQVDVWIADQISRSSGFGIYTHRAVARLRDGVTLDAARRELNGLIADVPRAYPSSAIARSIASDHMRSVALTLKDATVGSVSRALWILLASAGVVLLIACTNIANLFLVRAEVRQRELAIRRSLGAGWPGIVRYFVAESALLSLAGGSLGLALAWGALRLLVAVGPANLPRLGEIQLDGAIVLFAIALTLFVALVFGIIPLLHSAPLAASLHESGRANTASRSRHRTRYVLIGAQVALALVLLAAAGLLARSFQKLRTIDPGFNPSSTLTFRIGLPARAYVDRRAAVVAHQAILDGLSRMPGVIGASASTCLPLSGGCFGNTLMVEGRPFTADTPGVIANLVAVDGGYFSTMGMRIVQGRALEPGDIERRAPYVVVNRALVAALFSSQNAIGARIASNKPPPKPGEPPNLEWLTIVGVVSDTPTNALAERTRMPAMYMPMSIAGGPGIPDAALVGPNVATMSYVVRTRTPPAEMLASVRRVVDAVDADLAVAEVRTLDDIMGRASAQMAFTMILLVTASSVALVLGVIGIYGVMSYIVTQRTGEIGVRLALGAAPRSIARMIVRQGGAAALAGISAGLVAAVASGRAIDALLYDVSSRDPFTLVLAAIGLLGVALLACWLPARRAAALSPLEALRSE